MTESELQSAVFHIAGQMPSGKNAVKVTRTGHRYPGERFATWRDDAIIQLRKQGVPRRPIAGACVVEVDYARGDLRRRDVPGMIDALCHLIEKYGIVKDDAQLVEWHWTPAEFDGPGVRVNIVARGEPVVSRAPKPKRAAKARRKR